jgi:hypothetical protein
MHESASQGMLETCELCVTEHNLSYIQEAQWLQLNIKHTQQWWKTLCLANSQYTLSDPAPGH